MEKIIIDRPACVVACACFMFMLKQDAAHQLRIFFRHVCLSVRLSVHLSSEPSLPVLRSSPPPFFSFLGQESVSVNSVVSFASAAKKDGSIVLAGWTSGDWFGEVAGETDFAAVALDEDGVELWRWQVKDSGQLDPKKSSSAHDAAVSVGWRPYSVAVSSTFMCGFMSPATLCAGIYTVMSRQGSPTRKHYRPRCLVGR